MWKSLQCTRKPSYVSFCVQPNCQTINLKKYCCVCGCTVMLNISCCFFMGLYHVLYMCSGYKYILLYCCATPQNWLWFVTATPTVTMTCFPSSASASSCSSSSTSHLASPPVVFYVHIFPFYNNRIYVYYVPLSFWLCSSLLLRVSIYAPKLCLPPLRRPLVFSLRTHQEVQAAARTPPPATQTTLSWSLLTSRVRNPFVPGGPHTNVSFPLM